MIQSITLWELTSLVRSWWSTHFVPTWFAIFAQNFLHPTNPLVTSPVHFLWPTARVSAWQLAQRRIAVPFDGEGLCESSRGYNHVEDYWSSIHRTMQATQLIFRSPSVTLLWAYNFVCGCLWARRDRDSLPRMGHSRAPGATVAGVCRCYIRSSQAGLISDNTSRTAPAVPASLWEERYLFGGQHFIF